MKHYSVGVASGLGTELLPLVKMASKQLENYTIRVNALKKLHNTTALDEDLEAIAYLRESMNSSVTLVESRLSKGKLQAEKGIRLYREGKKDDAYRYLNEAFELWSDNITIRAYLSWLQAERRIEQRKKLKQLASRTYIRPGPSDITSAVSGLRSDISKTKSHTDARLLLEVIRKEDLVKAPDFVTRDLSGISKSEQSFGEIGILDGLVTRGGEYAGGETFRVSVTFGPRESFETKYDLRINELSNRIDTYMYISIGQALEWLEERSGNILKNYGITIHFKDMESGKGGDSLGAGFAVAAFSALYEVPADRQVTMTGSIRAYGGIAAVGGVPAKLQAAIKAGKSTIILPQDNEADLYMIPYEETRDIRIILADKIDTYMFHTLRGVPGKQDDWERSNELYKLARIHEDLGLLEQAHGIYEEVLKVSPGDYSSRVAVEHLRTRNVKSAKPGWVDERSFGDGPGGSLAIVIDEEKGTGLNDEDLKKIAAGAVNLGQQQLAKDKHDSLGQTLVNFAAFLNQADRGVLLLKGKMSRGLPITKPSGKAVSKAQLAGMLKARAARYQEADDDKLNIVATAYYALVLEHLLPGDDDSLIAVTEYESDTKEKATYAELFKKAESVARYNIPTLAQKEALKNEELKPKDVGTLAVQTQTPPSRTVVRSVPSRPIRTTPTTQPRPTRVTPPPSQPAVQVSRPAVKPYTFEPGFDPFLYYSFDNDSGTQVADGSRHRFNGTATGVSYTDGVHGKGLKTTTSRTYVDAPEKIKLGALKQLTVACWVRVDRFSTYGRLIGSGILNKGGSFNLSIGGTSGKAIFAVTLEDGQTVRVDPPRFAQTGQWYHVAGVYDGRTVKMYVNGKLHVKTDVPAGSQNKKLSGLQGEIIRIGASAARRTWTDTHINGAIDEVMIFHRALSEKQIARMAGQ